MDGHRKHSPAITESPIERVSLTAGNNLPAFFLPILFIENILLRAGCAVIAGDGGVDAVEADGIACAGGMAVTDPSCTEQFKNSDVAALKVVTDPGYEFAYWEMNGGIIQQASAEPLFLSTMPLFAGLVVVPTSRVATMKAHCLSVTLQSVTFAGMPAAVVKDDGTPYRAMPDAPLLGVSMPKAKPWRPNASRPHVFPCPAPSYSIFPKQFSCQFFLR